MLYGGDGGKVFRERHRFVWWVKVLRGQGWRRRRIFLASPRVWDDCEILGEIAGFGSNRRFHREEFAGIGGIGW